jgi:hypothetical protein
MNLARPADFARGSLRVDEVPNFAVLTGMPSTACRIARACCTAVASGFSIIAGKCRRAQGSTAVWRSNVLEHLAEIGEELIACEPVTLSAACGQFGVGIE